MKQALTVSIIIPVYNEESYLERCLRAIEQQTVQPLEVIVVDNNSTDNSVSIARSFPFVKILHEKRQSVLFARNTGFDAARGDIIGRIDADTIISHDWVARAQHDFVNHPDIGAITGPTAWYDLPLKIGSSTLVDIVASSLFTLDKRFPVLYGANMALRRDVWRAIRSEVCDSKRYHEDVDLAVHLYQKGYGLLYDRHFTAQVSTRRGDDSFADFLSYCNDRQVTFQEHGMNPWGSKIAQFFFITGWVLAWPFRQSYDERTQRYSIAHFFSGKNTPRKHPMH